MREFVLAGLYVGLATVFILLSGLALRLFNLRHYLHQKFVFLEVRPPTQTDKASTATRKLLEVLHGLEAARSWQDKLLGRNVVFAPEVVSTRKQGIRYLFRVPEAEATIFEQHIISHVNDVRIQRVDDFLPKEVDTARILEFRQTGHFAYPLRPQGDPEQHDPIAYLTGAMTKLSPSEMIVFQLVITPVKVHEAEALADRILRNKEAVYRLGRERIPGRRAVFGAITSTLLGVAQSIGDIASASSSRSYYAYHKESYREQEVAKGIKPARQLSMLEERLGESVHRKLSEPLFRVNVRALVLVKRTQDAKQRVKGVKTSLASFSRPKYQSLHAQRTFFKSYRAFQFKHRLPSFTSSKACLLSAPEIADIYHFPNPTTAKTENIVKSLSPTLPAPLSLKDGTKFDVILGENHHQGTRTKIGLTTKDRERHVYIVGGTGNGKTTMILYSITQDIQSGKGLAVIDPHGDLAETILQHVPKDRVDDVVYLNPDDLAYPVGLNMLELTPGLTGDELLREKDLVTESVISVFRKIFSDDDSGGHRIEYVLRNTVQTALTTEQPTLFTVYDLLNDPAYRKAVLKRLEDKDLKNFWKNELGKAGGFQQVKMVAGITAKVGRFLFSASAKRILEQPKSTVDFDDILNSGKILICNFSKGLIGEDTSELFGVTVLAKLQMAALRRARINQTERRPFYLYVDEFQNFATMSFVQMLSEARKYKLFLIMAEQSVSQQEEQRMVNIILANVGTVICFRSANPMDEKMLLPMFAPYLADGQVANLPSFNFYIRMAAVKPQEPTSGETLLLEDKGSSKVAVSIRAASRKNYAIEYKAPAENPKGKTTAKRESPAPKRPGDE